MPHVAIRFPQALHHSLDSSQKLLIIFSQTDGSIRFMEVELTRVADLLVGGAEAEGLQNFTGSGTADIVGESDLLLFGLHN